MYRWRMEISLLVRLSAKITYSGRLHTRSIICWHVFKDIARCKPNCSECKGRTIVCAAPWKMLYLLRMNSSVPERQLHVWLKHSNSPRVGAWLECQCRVGRSSIQLLRN